MSPRPKILIVDDKPENLFVLEKVLSDTDAEIIKATSGNDALVASLNHSFALAILDVQMPEMDGYELAELLRSGARTRSLPIIFLSAVYSDDYHVFRGYEAGAVDFITKPYHPVILLGKVKVFLELGRQKEDLIQKIELERSKRYLESILLSMTDPIIVTSPDGLIRDVNRAATHLLRRSRQECIGMTVSALLGSGRFPFLYALSEQEPHAGRKKEGEFRNREDRLITKSGRGIPVLLSGSLFHDDGGRLLGTVLVARDITERKHAEEQLKLYAEKLERSNQELQEFAFVASHDLQEPLRKIQTFSSRIMATSRTSLDEQGLDYLERMLSAAERMRSLIQSLLHYSRVTTKAEPFVEVDLNSLIQEVLVDLELRVEQSGGTIEVEPLATLEADPQQIRQLMLNLIGNALKFHGEKPPIIRISGYITQEISPHGTAREPSAYQITVEDNGIGFDEKYLDRIFSPFQRLHGRSAYEGTGMGLAICRKIAERHGGSITARSTPGKGSTFIVTIPLKKR